MRKSVSFFALSALICGSACSSSPEPCQVEGLSFVRAQGPALGYEPGFHDTAIDSQGNVYFAFLQGTTLSIQGVEYPSTNGRAELLISLDPSGTVRWGKSIFPSSSAAVNDILVAADGSLVVAAYASGDSADVFGTLVSLPSTGIMGNFLVARLDSNGVVQDVDVSPDLAPNRSGVQRLANGASGHVIESGFVCGTSTHACGSTQTRATDSCRRFVCEVDALGAYVRFAELDVLPDASRGFELVRGRDGKLYGYQELIQSVTPFNSPTVTTSSPNRGSTFIVTFDDQLRIVAARDIGTSRIVGLQVDAQGRMIVAGQGYTSLVDHTFTPCGDLATCDIFFVAAFSTNWTIEWVSEATTSSNRADLLSLALLDDGTTIVSGTVGESNIEFPDATVRASRGNPDQRFYVHHAQDGRVLAHALAPLIGIPYQQADAISGAGVVHTLGEVLHEPHASSACVGAPNPPSPRDWSLDFVSFDFVAP